MENSAQTITLETNVAEQMKAQEEKRKLWLSDKADFLLASDNKKELVVDLITDFNKILGATKQIDKICREGVKQHSLMGLRSALVEVIQLFDADYQYYPEASPK